MADSLKRQLEIARFDRAREVVESMAQHRVLLTTAELARLNTILTGKNSTEPGGPWRKGPVTLILPSGKTEELSLIADPVMNAREKLHKSTEQAESGAVIDAAVNIYVGLVMAHVFEDANRRTAVLATQYFLSRYGNPIPSLALHELGLGDLREEGSIEALREVIRQMAKFAEKKRPLRSV